MPDNKNQHTYQTIFEVQDGPSREVHFSLRDDGVYIISRCQVLKGGEKVYMRSSVMMNDQIAVEVAHKILQHFNKQ